MYCPEKLKLNKFRLVSIPKNRDFFARLGGTRPSVPSGAFTGDDYIPSGMRKIDQLSAAQKMELNNLRAEAAEARNKAQTDSSDEK